MAATDTSSAGDVVLDEKKMLDDLKTLCRSIVHSFRDEQHQIQDTLGSYKNVLTLYIKNTFYSDECREHILNRFLVDSVLSLMKRQHNHYLSDWVMADLVSECCQLLMQIAVPLIGNDHPLAWYIVFYCMNSSTSFFRHFGLDWVCTNECIVMFGARRSDMCFLPPLEAKERPRADDVGGGAVRGMA